MSAYPPRDSLEIKFCPVCGTPCAGVVRLAEDGHTFDAAAGFFVEENDTAVLKGGVALGRNVKRLTVEHQRRAAALLRNFGLAMDWFHNGRRRSANLNAISHSLQGKHHGNSR